MNSLRLFVLLLIGFPVLAAAPKKIIVIGDSITEGYGVSREQAYPSLVQKLADKNGQSWNVINAGISGSTSASAPSRVNWHLKQKPDLIVLALGGNDGLRGAPVQSIADNLSAALQLCQKASVKVILAGIQIPPNYGAEYSKNFAAVFPRVAHKFKVPLIPFLLQNVGGKRDLNLADGIHPNEKGHAEIADTVYRAILKNL